MERDAVAPPVLQRGDPLYHLPELLFVIVHAGDDEVRQFQMTPVRGHHDGILDGFEVSLQYIAIGLFAERFEVKVHGVRQGQDLLQDFRLCGPVADEDRFQALRLAGFERVPHELVVDEGLVVGERDANVPLRLQFLRQSDELVRRVELRPDVVVPRLGDLMVLAERAAQVAAIAADREDHAPGPEPRQRFLFDRVQLQRGHFTVRVAHDPAVQALSRPAEAELVPAELTMSKTDITGCRHTVTPLSIYSLAHSCQKSKLDRSKVNYKSAELLHVVVSDTPLKEFTHKYGLDLLLYVVGD